MPREREKARSILARAPCRVDLAGGTVDMWPLYLFHPGAVTVNFAVSIYTTCRLRPRTQAGIELRSLDTGIGERFDSLAELESARPRHALAACLVRHFQPRGGLVVETDSQSPAGAGISGSSALIIASVAALARYSGRRMAAERIRELAQNLEARLIRVPTGCQDYYPALYGGVSAVHLEAGGIRREAIPLQPAELDARFVLAYTGAPRQSGINNWEVFQAHINGDRRVFQNFERIAQIARAMHRALASSDWEEAARLLQEEWKLRRTNAPGISTPSIERLIAVAGRNGARAAKVCGAGGGGCVVFLTEPEARAQVVRALADAGAQVLDCRVSRRGLQVRSEG